MAFMTGNLSCQIEHHLYPDLPSYRLAEISVKVRALCEKYDLPHTSGWRPPGIDYHDRRGAALARPVSVGMTRTEAVVRL